MNRAPESLNDAGQPLPECKCPCCGYEADCASCVVPGHYEARPHPGDITLCIKCGEILTFDAQLNQVQIGLAALMDLQKNDPKAWRILSRAQDLIRTGEHLK